MSLRRLMPALLAATAALPAVALGAVLIAVPGAGIGPSAAADVVPAAHAAAATTEPPNTSPFPPGPPTNLAASAVSSSSITLTWTRSVPGCCSVVGYNIGYMRAFDDVGFPLTLGNVNTVTIGNLSRATEYRFWLYARDDQGRTSASTSLTVVTPVTDTGPDTTPPAAPTGLTAGEVTPTTAMLSWSPSTDNIGVTGYQVYRFDGFFISTPLATVTGTSFQVPLNMGRNQFYVRARDAVGNVSIAAGPVTVQGTGTPSTPPRTTPPAPTCRITYTTQAQWTGGFVALVTITNTGPDTINGWTLGFSFPNGQQIGNGWNAVIAQSGPSVTARNVAYNGTLAPGASTSFGFQGGHTGTNQPPTAFTLNDTPCTTT